MHIEAVKAARGRDMTVSVVIPFDDSTIPCGPTSWTAKKSHTSNMRKRSSVAFITLVKAMSRTGVAAGL